MQASIRKHARFRTSVTDRGWRKPPPITRALQLSGMVLLGMLHGAALAAVPGAGDILRETEQRPPSTPTPAPSIQLDAPPRPALKAAPGMRITVKSFRITGTTVFSEAELLPLLRDHVGRELAFADLEQAAGLITGHYRDRGYFLAQAYLPEQRIQDGVIEITVLEGRLGQIRINRAPGVRLGESQARGFIEGSAMPGAVLEQGRAERGLLLLSDLPGVSVTGELAPGEQVGTTDLNVQVQERPLFTGNLSLNNYGSRFTGEYRLGAGLNISDPLGLGDLLSLRGLITDGRGLQNIAASYLLPLGRQGTRVGVSYSDLRYELGKDFAALDADGAAQVAGLSLQHPFIRGRSFNLYGQLAWEQKRLEDRQGATAFVNQRRIDTLAMGLSLDGRDALLGGGLNFAGLSWVSGDLDLRTAAIAAADATAGGRGARGGFQKVVYSVSRTQAVRGPLTAYLAVHGQTASKNLDSAEKFSLGGPYGVRAYPAAEASGDAGYVLNAELRWALRAGSGSLTLIGFYDYGHSRINRNPTPADVNNTTHRAGYGVGLDWLRPGTLSLRTSVAWRDTGPSTADPGGDRNARILVQAVTYF